MKERFSWRCFLVLSLLILPGVTLADSITLTTAVGNPQGSSQTLQETGGYTANTYLYILAKAKNRATQQISSIGATKDKPNAGNWQGTLQLVVGNYDCWGELHSRDGEGNEVITTSNTIASVGVNF
jgi:hypothetical protein